jgi:hypothetical protein
VSLLEGLRQPDQLSCGPSSLVAARMLLDDTYRPSDFAAEVLALHRVVTSAAASGLPWPRALGTPPWAVERQLERWTGDDWHVQVARFGAARVPVGTSGPVPTYIGSRTLPRHVVLDLGNGVFYDPARGSVGPLRSSWTRLWFMIASRSSNGRNADFIALSANHSRSRTV